MIVLLALLAALCIIITGLYVVELRKSTANYTATLLESMKGLNRHRALQHVRREMFEQSMFLLLFLALAVFFIVQLP